MSPLAPFSPHGDYQDVAPEQRLPGPESAKDGEGVRDLRAHLRGPSRPRRGAEAGAELAEERRPHRLEDRGVVGGLGVAMGVRVV